MRLITAEAAFERMDFYEKLLFKVRNTLGRFDIPCRSATVIRNLFSIILDVNKTRAQTLTFLLAVHNAIHSPYA